MYEEELYHHGIKGQRWGIRRFQNPDGSLTSAGKQRYLKAERELKSARATIRQQQKDIDELRNSGNKVSSSSSQTSNLSNQELKLAIERVKLEREYQTLLHGPDKNKVAKGESYISKTLKQMGSNALGKLGEQVGTGIGQLASKAIYATAAPKFKEKFNIDIMNDKQKKQQKQDKDN